MRNGQLWVTRIQNTCEKITSNEKQSGFILCAGFFFYLLLDSSPIFGKFKHWISITAGMMALASFPFVLCNFRKISTQYLLRPPFAFYFLFILSGIVLSPFAINIKTAMVYSAYYGIWAMFSIILVECVRLSKLLLAIQSVMAISIIASFATHFMGIFDGYFHGPGTLVPRFCGLMGNPNPMGAMCSIYLIVTLAFFTKEGIKEYLATNRLIFLLVFSLATPISIWILWQSRSRSALMALFAAVIGFLLIRLSVKDYIKGGSKRSRLAYGLSIILAGSTAWFLIQSISTRTITDLSTILARIDLYKFTWAKILEHPFVGYGMGSSKFVLIDFGNDWAICGAHNIILEAALYSGILGGLIFGCFLFSSLYKFPRLISCFGADTNRIGVLFLLYLLLSIGEPILLGVPRSGLLIFLIGVATIAKADNNPHKGPAIIMVISDEIKVL